MENLREKLARRMRELMRTTLVDTQVKVATKSQTSQATVQRVLSCEQAATVDVLAKLSQAFGIKNPAHLLLEDDEIRLLSVWGTLSDTDKMNILGFINVQKSLNGGTKEADQFNLVSTTSVTPSGSGLPGGTFNTDETRPADSKKNRRRKA